MPEISVIVPIHNTKKYLKQCIDSIINQTFSNLEIILVDDASSDGSGKICDNYAIKDERIKVVHKKWGGIVAARKEGLKLACGEYVGFVDSDDWIEPDFYQYMYNIIKDYRVSAVETGIIDTTDNYQNNRTSIISQGYYDADSYVEIVTPKMMYSGNFYEYGVTPYVWNKLFVKTKFESFYMNIEDGCDMFEDEASVYPFLISEKSLYISKKCYYHYRVRTASLKRCASEELLVKINKNAELIYNAIIKSSEEYILEQQYWNNLLYKYIWFAPYVFDNNNILQVFGGIKSNECVILYGAGAVGINIRNYLNKKKINIIDWVDKQYEYLEKSLPVHNPRKADYNHADKIIITVLRYKDKEFIKSELVSMGIPENKIMWVKDEYIKNPKNAINKVFGDKYV